MEPAETQPVFDDPALKTAVTRAWAGERAPDGLRRRVMELAAAQREEDRLRIVPAVAPASRGGVWRHPWTRYGLAAAAMVAIGFGLASRLDHRQGGLDLGGGNTLAVTPVLPASLAKELVQRHDRCRQVNASHGLSQTPQGNFDDIRQKLHERLGFPVLAGPIDDGTGRPAEGWTFRGAAVCPVNNVEAAHLVFSRGNQVISVFSLPRGACPTAHGDEEAEDANPDHPIAVWVWSDGVHCVVGSSDDRSLSVDQVRSVLEHLRPTVAPPKNR